MSLNFILVENEKTLFCVPSKKGFDKSILLSIPLNKYALFYIPNLPVVKDAPYTVP